MFKLDHTVQLCKKYRTLFLSWGIIESTLNKRQNVVVLLFTNKLTITSEELQTS